MSFPGNHSEEEEPTTCRCTSFGEAASTFSRDRLVPSETTNFFRCFYNGFTKEKKVWYAPQGKQNMFEHPIKFSFEYVDTETDNMATLGEAITPGILSVNFFTGWSHQPSYEFYYPSITAYQLGFGQLPVCLFFADLVKPWEIVNSGLEYDHLKNLSPGAETIDLEGLFINSFTTKPFKHWWSEWCLHLFCELSQTYCRRFDPNFVAPDNEVPRCFL